MVRAVDDFDAWLDQEGLCLASTKRNVCWERPVPGWQRGFRFCEQHLSRCADLVPLPPGFTPPVSVEELRARRRKKNEDVLGSPIRALVAPYVRESPEIRDIEFARMLDVSPNLVGTVRRILEEYGDIPCVPHHLRMSLDEWRLKDE